MVAISCSLAAVTDRCPALLGLHGADNLKRIHLHLLGLLLCCLLLLPGGLQFLLGNFSSGRLSLFLLLLVSCELWLFERIKEPVWEILSLFDLPLLLPLLLSQFLCELAWAKHIDGSLVQDSDPFPFSFECFLDLSLKDFLSLRNEVRHLNLHKRSVDLVLNVIDVRVVVESSALGNEALWHVLSACIDLLYLEIFEFLIFFIAADTAAERESTALRMLNTFGSGWVGDPEWAVNAVAVLGRRGIRVDSVDDVVAGSAEVICAPAAVGRDRAAIHALPVSEFNAVLLALSHADTHLLEQALLAEEVLFVGLTPLICLHLLLTVDQTAEVRLLAAVALIE